jgi:hypothetical protein
MRLELFILLSGKMLEGRLRTRLSSILGDDSAIKSEHSTEG